MEKIPAPEEAGTSQHEKERSGQFSPHPMWADHERGEDGGEVVNSKVKETRTQEIARLLGREHAADIDVEGYESGRDR